MITKQRDNKESETKKTSEFPNIARPQWWDGALPKHWLTTPHSLSPTLGTLPHTMVRSQASWWTIGRDSGLEPSCPHTHFLCLAFLLLLSSASLFFSLPLLCTLTSLSSSFLLPPLRWFGSLNLTIISHQWWWSGSDCNSSSNRTVGSCSMTSLG